MTDSLDEMLAGMVKPLEWEGVEATSMWAAQKWSVIRETWWCYRVTLTADRSHRLVLEMAGNTNVGLGLHSTWDDAKSAAQQDYARRVCAALNPDILLGMREALQPFADACHLLENDTDDAPAGGWVVFSEEEETFIPRVRDFRRAQTALRSLSPKDPSNGK